MLSAPACLPASQLFPDVPIDQSIEDRNAVIIGMGSKWNAYQSCVTTAGGPNPFQACKFPFEFQGQHNQRCVYSLPTPSAQLEICNQFHTQVCFKNIYQELVQNIF